MIRLAIRCRPEQAEAVLAELAVLAPSGVEESREGELVEYAIYGGPGEIPQLGEIEAAVGGALVEVDSREVAEDWSERWRAFHKPVLVGGRVLVRPPWSDPREAVIAGLRAADETASPAVVAEGAEVAALSSEEAVGTGADEAPQPERGVIDVVIDPGQAFGTGAHPTTRLCLEALIGWLDSAGTGRGPGPLCDLGAGSGVLAIAAAKLGFSPVAAYDHDPAAVTAARDNAAANRVEIEAHRADLRAGLPPLAPVTVANLMAPLLIELASMFTAMQSPRVPTSTGTPGTPAMSDTPGEPSTPKVRGTQGTPGTPAADSHRQTPLPELLICSGILPEQADGVRDAFAAAGFTERSRAVDTGWASLTLVAG